MQIHIQNDHFFIRVSVKISPGHIIHLLLVGWRNLFSSCAVVCQFLVLAGNRFWCTYVLRVQYSCGVVLVFLFWWEIVFGFAYVLSIQISCAVVSVFWL
jgi:hypothetical protein